jgi:cobaltochelatase CobN
MSVPGLENQAKEFRQALEAVKNPPPAAKAISGPAAPEGKKPTADVPAKEGQASPEGNRQKVEGYEVQEVNRSGFAAAPIPYVFIFGFLVFLALIRWGWRRKADKTGR